MKIFYGLLIVVLLMCEVASAQMTVNKELAKLSWLEGKWERQNTRAGQTAFEVWNKQELGFFGEGIAMRGTDTVFIEKLSIKEKEGNLYYVAEVSQNAEPTYFKITEITQAGFICENPDHDFPKKIVYQLEDGGQLKATISGDGKSIPFMFRKVNY